PVADLKFAQGTPSVVGEERMVRRGLDLSAGPEAYPEHLFDAAGEDVRHRPWNESQPLIQRPHGEATLARFQQLRERNLAAGVSAQDARTGGHATRLPQVREQGALVVALFGAAVELGNRDDGDV